MSSFGRVFRGHVRGRVTARKTYRHKQKVFTHSKLGDKNYYKGWGAPGWATGDKNRQGRYLYNKHKVAKYLFSVPDLEAFPLRAYVEPSVLRPCSRDDGTIAEGTDVAALIKSVVQNSKKPSTYLRNPRSTEQARE